MINLDRVYTCLSSNDALRAVGGKQGVILLNAQDEIIPLTEKEVHKIRLDCGNLISLASSSIIETYDVATLKNISTLLNNKHVQDLAWSRAGQLASCSKDSKLCIWDLRLNKPAICFNTTKGVGIYSLSWSKQSNDLLVSAHETALKLWDARFSKKSLTTVRSAHPGRIVHLDWSSSSSLILSTSLLNSVKCWKTSGSSLSLSSSTQTHFQSIKSLFSPDSSRVVLTTEQNEGKIQVLHTEDLKNLSSHSFLNAVEDICWQGKVLSVLCADRTLRSLSLDKENKDLNNGLGDENSGLESVDCDFNILGFEEDMKTMESDPKEGVNVEDFSLSQRYCLIRIHNKREFLRVHFSFPKEYPESPPVYSLKGCSMYLSSTALEIVKAFEAELNKRSKQLVKSKGYTVQKICDFILDFLNSMTETDGYEDFNDLLEILECQNYSKNSQIGCIHAWHPNGDLLVFTTSELQNNYAETEDLFDIESSHYQAGIQ
jgi:hypothetical protein